MESSVSSNMEPFHADWFGQYKYDSFCMHHTTTETTTVRCHKNSWMNLFNKYLLLVTFETDDNYSIQFEISNNSSTIRFDSKWKNTIRTALLVLMYNCCCRGQRAICCCLVDWRGCSVVVVCCLIRLLVFFAVHLPGHHRSPTELPLVEAVSCVLSTG